MIYAAVSGISHFARSWTPIRSGRTARSSTCIHDRLETTTAGLVASPASGGSYTASKHGIGGLTKTAALEYARSGLRVNAVCPGVIDTPLVQRHIGRRPELRERLIAAEPVGRLGTPEEVAAAVVWLCSDAASFVTGVAFPVDGGYVAR
jgi:NAD(P)-dependent dehydrogenase (short-subunit alcohol dehydrogenase family)